MNPDAFRSSARGRVRRTLDGYWAFFPEPTPKEVSLVPDLVKLLDDATAAVNRLGGVGRLLPNPHILIGPHLRLEAVLSSRIEGTKTDVEGLLRFEAGQRPDGEMEDDVTEVRNYVEALEHGLQRIASGFPISSRLFCEMHQHLLKGVRGANKQPGTIRSSPVWIGGSALSDAVFVPPPVEEMHRSLSDLEGFLHRTDLPLLLQMAIAHYQFEVIHPFLDGNGRIGRLLIPLMLVQRNMLSQPLLYLSAYFERNRSDYYRHLLGVSQDGDFAPWFSFFFKGVREQATESEERTVRLVELQRNMREALLEEGRPTSVVRLGERLAAFPVVTASQVSSELALSRPTAQTAIDTLVERGDLREVTGQTRNRVYVAEAILGAVYGKLEMPTEANEDLHEQLSIFGGRES